jgi:hypothetical protein
MPIHHATVKRANRQGLNIIEENDGFVLVRIEDGWKSQAYDSTAEALEEFERGETEFTDPNEDADDEPNLSGSVVKPGYHAAYSSNPEGPGCGDTLDVEMRRAVMRIAEGSREPRVDLAELRHIGIHNDLWRGEWERLNPGMQRMNLANRLRAYLRQDAERQVFLGSQGTGRFGVPVRPAKGKVKKTKKGA